MSKSVDQHVVEMRFDNKHFEQNVSTTLSTIEKLKQKLNFGGAAKGLEDINAASKKVDMAGLGTAVESVNAKFSALQVIGVTALANITNSAVNAGKRIVSALTIDPVKTGFQEYETQINAVQTILANTESKGSTIDDVNRALEELNKYADKTIYNFTEMTRNIGTFTAAGVDLDTSVSAIQGIANLAAVSGSTSQQASTAMYQLSQALASGTVKLMDWNSVVNAGMGGEVFQNALKQTARVHGIAIDEMIESEGSFRETLSNGWLTSDILTETLEQFTMAADESSDEWNAFKKSLMEKGYTESQANEILKLANTATDAATKVKTFTQLWDVLKESAQSGWSQTWKLVIGDFEEAKDLLSPLADFLTGFINKMSDARNWLVQGALDFATPWTNIMKKLEGAGLGNIKKVTETISDFTDKLTYFQDVVNDVWRGDYNNSDTGRYKLLEAAGYDHRVVQDLVNLGYGYKITVEDIEASHAKFGLTMEKTTAETQDLTAALNNLTDEQLKEAGLTEDEIRLYRDLAKEAERTGKSIGELADEMSKNDGRTLLIESFKNAGSGLLGVFTALKNAWVEIFPPMSVVQLYNIIKAINTFSEKLRLTDKETGELTDTAKKLQRVFKGVFAIIDIFATILGGGLKIALQAVSALLGYFGTDILTVSAVIGDALVKFRDFIDSSLDFTKVFEKIIPFIKKAIDSFKTWKDSLADAENLPKAIAEGMMKWFGYLVKPLAGLLDKIRSYLTGGFESIPGDMISGFANGIWNGIKVAGQVMLELGKIIIDKIKTVLGIHSPSTVFFAIGGFIIAGLVGGLLAGSGEIGGTLKIIGEKIASFFGDVDFGTVVSTAISAGLLATLIKVGKFLGALTSPLEGIGEIFENAGTILKSVNKVVKSFSGVLKSISANIRADAIKSLAVAILILVGAITILTLLDVKKVWAAIGAITVLAVILGALFFAINKMGSSSNPKDAVKGIANMASIGAMLLGLSVSLLLIAATLKIIETIDPDKAVMAFGGLAAIVLSIIGVLAVFGSLVKGKSALNIGKVGSMLLGVSVAILLMSIVIKTLGNLDTATLIQGGVAILLFSGIIVGLIAATKLAGKNIGKIGSTILSISAALLLMSAAVKLLGGMDRAALIQGGVAILLFSGIIVGLIAATKLAGKDMGKLGSTLLGIGVAFLAMAIVTKILGGMDVATLSKGIIATTALAGVIVGLVAATKLVGEKDLKRVGTTILLTSFAIGLLALTAAMLSLLDVASLAKGIGAVAVLGAIMAMLIWSTKNAQDCKGNLIVMTIAIVALAASVAALSMIDATRLAVATGCLTALIGMFALLVKVAGTAKGSLGTLIVMTIAVGLIGGMLYLLSGLPTESVIGTAISLSVLLLAMSAALVILSAIGKSIGSALLGVLALTAMAVPLLAFVGVLALMQGVDNAIRNATILIALSTVLTLLLIPLTLVGSLIGPALLGVLALTAMAVPLLAFVGVLALMEGVENANANVNILIKLMASMTAMMLVVGLLAPLAIAGTAAIAAMSAMIVGLGALIVGIGYLMTEFPQLEEFLNKGIPVIEKIGIALGAFFGNIVSGFIDSVSNSLPGLGENLSAFMDSVRPFIDGVKMVDESVLKGVGYLAGAIILLTAADFISGILSFMQGGSSFASLGAELSMFAMNAAPFFAAARMIDPAAMDGIKTLAEMVLILTAADVLNGLTSWFTGGSSLKDFGEQLPDLGSNIASFSRNLGTFTEDQVTAVDCAGKAIKALASAAKELPNEGGLWASIVGDNSLATFSGYLPGLGTNLSTFVTNLGTFTEEQVTTVTCACDAIKSLAKAAKEIPNEGGLWASIVGENSLATFSGYLPKLGTNLKGFITNLGTFTEDQVTTIDCAGRAIKALATSAKELPNDGGLWGKIFGENSLASFGEQLSGFGANLRQFVNGVGGLTDKQVTAVNTAVKIINSLSTLSNTNLDPKNLKSFGENILSFGEDYADFCEDMSSVSTSDISGAISKLNSIINAIKSITQSTCTTIKSFGDALKNVGKNAVDDFVSAFTGKATQTDIEGAVSKMIGFFTTKVSKEQDKVNKAFTNLVDNAVSALEKKDDISDIGKNMAQSFAKGITDNKYLATNAGKSLASAAIDAAKKQLDINSPSKVAMAMGTSVPEGFAMGISKFSNMVSASSTDMADVAIDGVRDSLSSISDVVNSNIDTQPTIRPVLDLSGVESRAGILSNLFNTRASVGVLANIGAISSMMNSRQNGTNNDIISAIDKLRSSMNNSNGNTYNINGVTYDDGSNVRDAIEAIVRYAIADRRM